MEGKPKKKNAGKGFRSQPERGHVLDLRGMIIPLTLLKITQALRNMKAGETLDIVGSDPDTRKDFLTVLKTSSCEVLHITDDQNRYLIRLRKGRM